jgi:hypothetical protein
MIATFGFRCLLDGMPVSFGFPSAPELGSVFEARVRVQSFWLCEEEPPKRLSGSSETTVLDFG